MQERDRNVLNFINLVGVVNRDQIKKLFFQEVNQNVCMRRLKYLAENEFVQRFKYEGNTFIYYVDKKPSKRLINHDLHITDFVINMIENGFEIIELKKPFIIGDIMSDAYIKYSDTEGRIKHLVLEVQLSNKVEDCVLKYKEFKNYILENKKGWKTIPRIIVITDMKERVELNGYKVLYDDTKMENIKNLI